MLNTKPSSINPPFECTESFKHIYAQAGATIMRCGTWRPVPAGTTLQAGAQTTPRASGQSTAPAACASWLVRVSWNFHFISSPLATMASKIIFVMLDRILTCSDHTCLIACPAKLSLEAGCKWSAISALICRAHFGRGCGGVASEQPLHRDGIQRPHREALGHPGRHRTPHPRWPPCCGLHPLSCLYFKLLADLQSTSC